MDCLLARLAIRRFLKAQPTDVGPPIAGDSLTEMRPSYDPSPYDTDRDSHPRLIRPARSQPSYMTLNST
jgi:hypothetical protein